MLASPTRRQLRPRSAPCVYVLVLCSCASTVVGGVGDAGGSADAERDAPETADAMATDAATPPTIASDLAAHGPCIALTDRTGRCWGWNLAGRTGGGGNERTGSVPRPVAVQGLANARRLATGSAVSAAVLTDGSVACWGAALLCGDANIQATYAQATPIPLLTGVVDLAFAQESGCALRGDGTVACWGSNREGICDPEHPASGERAPTPHAPAQVGGLSEITQLSASGSFACGRRRDGRVRCWGFARSGQLGDGRSNVASDGVIEVPGTTDALEVEVGEVGVCVVTTARTVRCWGGRRSGAELCGEGTPCGLPAMVEGLTGVRHVRLGTSHGCAVLDDGTVRCWGQSSPGLPGGTVRESPVPIEGLTRVRDLGTTSATVYALTEEGTVFAWGSNWEGSLGAGDAGVASSPTPVQVRW